jgi:hypothetical protein
MGTSTSYSCRVGIYHRPDAFSIPETKWMQELSNMAKKEVHMSMGEFGWMYASPHFYLTIGVGDSSLDLLV